MVREEIYNDIFLWRPRFCRLCLELTEEFEDAVVLVQLADGGHQERLVVADGAGESELLDVLVVRSFVDQVADDESALEDERGSYSRNLFLLLLVIIIIITIILTIIIFIIVMDYSLM